MKCYCPKCGTVIEMDDEREQKKRKPGSGPNLTVAWLFIGIFALAFLWSITQGGLRWQVCCGNVTRKKN
jgi:hypothetical protein